MTSRAPSTHLLGRLATSPRLRPVLTGLAAFVFLVAGTLPVSAQATTTLTTTAPGGAATGNSAAADVERSSADLVNGTVTQLSTVDLAGIAQAGTTSTTTATITPPKKTTVATTKPVVKPAVKPASRPAPPRITLPPQPPKPITFAGRNHVWIPSLDINQSVYGFACTRSKEPDNLTYRWGCAGSNNVYLLGHAYGVFKPLHDAYYNGKLKKGMKVMYADGTGTVHTYSVLWWRVVKPTTDAAWAWAPLASPGMTLQTCLGANSEYRLMVRLDEVG